jgi:hypothetical protein
MVTKSFKEVFSNNVGYLVGILLLMLHYKSHVDLFVYARDDADLWI